MKTACIKYSCLISTHISAHHGAPHSISDKDLVKDNRKAVNIRLGGHHTDIGPGVTGDKHRVRGVCVELQQLRVTPQHLGGSPQLAPEILVTILSDIS